MRIRRKKHLKDRINDLSCNLIVADYDIPNINLAIADKKYFDYKSLFNNNNPVEIEIGCGKGGFICQKASLNKDINYMAIELIDNVIVMASERAKKENLTNIKFFNCGADYLPRYILDNSVSAIYLNFSPPFLGLRYENRRLTKPQLVKNYYDFLTENGRVELKTDCEEFFEYSKQSFSDGGFSVKDLSNKLCDTTFNNVITEYESKFISQNKKIFYFVAKKI